jgi:hypothetical protein
MSATDLSRTTATRHDTNLAENLPGIIERLANMPPSVEAPYLTAYIDWQPDGYSPGRRAGMRVYTDAIEPFLAHHEPHTPARESLEADVTRVTAYLEGEAPDEAQGIMAVACNATGVFETFPLGVRVPTELSHGPTPALRTLLRALNNAPSFAVVQLDQREANIFVVRQGRPAATLDIDSTDSTREDRSTSGKETTIALRAEGQDEAFVREVGDKLRIVLDRGNVEGYVVLGDETVLPLMEREFPKALLERCLGTANGDMREIPEQAIERAMPIVLAHEREREAAAVQQARDLSKAGGPGVTGLDDTLTALQSGQVETLILTDDFNALGWADYTFPVYGTGMPHSQHPAGGDPRNMTPVSMPDELVRLAVQSSAAVETVRSDVPVTAEEEDRIPDAHADGEMPRSDAARMLDGLGGVAAILRFALAEDQQTAN